MDIQRGNSASIFSAATVGLIVIGGLHLLGSLIVLIAGVAGKNPWDSTPGAIGLIFAGLFAVGVLLIAFGLALHLLSAQYKQTLSQTKLLEALGDGFRLPPVQPAAQQKSGGAVTLLSLATAAANLPAEDKIHDPSRTQTLELLQQIRDAALMTEVQRLECAKAHWAKRKETVSRLVDRHILSGDWSSARVRVDELRALLPEDAEVLDLSERLAGEHASRLTEDLSAARAQLRHLLSITAWQEAEEIVASLQKKYPNDTQVGHLTADIFHEREKLERHNRERLLSELADATERRQWRRAITAAEDFIQRYPTDTYAERLQFDLPTLHENAAAADRKEQEQLFKDLLKQQRYEDAETVARGLIDKYPGSPAAAELLRMLPKVEELHRQEKLKRPAATASTVNT